MKRAAGPGPESRWRPQPTAVPPATAAGGGDGLDPSQREDVDERVVGGAVPIAPEVRGVEPRRDGRIWGPYVL